MISNIIVNYIDDNYDNLTIGEGLYAEYGSGQKYVVVKTTNTVDLDETLEAHRVSEIQVLVSGYKTEEGYELSQELLTLIMNMEGNTYTYTFENGGKTETVEVKTVVIRNYPIPISYNNNRICSTNFEMKYSYEIE